MEKRIDFQQNGNTLEGNIQRAQCYCTEVQAALANHVIVQGLQEKRNIIWVGWQEKENITRAGGVLRYHEGECLGGFTAKLGYCNMEEAELWVLVRGGTIGPPIWVG